MPAPKKKTNDADISMKNTKQELLDAYHETLKQLHEKEKAQLKPEEKLKEKISNREKEFESLQAQVAEFPQKLQGALAKAVEESAERIELETRYQKDLLQKEFEGQRNVLTARIQSLEKTVEEQNEQTARLSTQQDAAYQKIQDVAVKAIEGASKASSFSDLQRVLSEQVKKKQTNDH